MKQESMQRPDTVLRWPAYLMLCGLVCILLGTAGLFVTRQYPSMIQASNTIGYFGLFLVLTGFFMHISLDSF